MSQNNSNDKAAMLAKIEGINEVEGFDPTPFAVDYTDLETGEVRKRLPVMIQMAWFRMKYPEGRIAITVSPGKDCFVATAKVYPSYKDGAECYLAEATASRGYLADKPSVSPREWAQTAAVGIALRNAGFGLQFAMAGDEFEGTATDELNGNSAQAGGSTPPKNPAVAPKPETEEEYTVEPTAPPQRELTFEEKVEQAMRVPCPITPMSVTLPCVSPLYSPLCSSKIRQQQRRQLTASPAAASGLPPPPMTSFAVLWRRYWLVPLPMGNKTTGCRLPLQWRSVPAPAPILSAPHSCGRLPAGSSPRMCSLSSEPFIPVSCRCGFRLLR